MRRKVTVVGAGNVGATCAQELARGDYCDVALVDIKEGLAEGKALDINQAAATCSVTDPTMFSFVETRSSRLMSPVRGTPAVTTTMSEPLVIA